MKKKLFFNYIRHAMIVVVYLVLNRLMLLLLLNETTLNIKFSIHQHINKLQITIKNITEVIFFRF